VRRTQNHTYCTGNTHIGDKHVEKGQGKAEDRSDGTLRIFTAARRPDAHGAPTRAACAVTHTAQTRPDSPARGRQRGVRVKG